MRTIIILSALALGACNRSPEPTKADAAKASETVTYACDNGKTATVIYTSTGTPEDTATVTIDGKTTVFKSAVSASGAKYDAAGPTGTASWWNKGEEASLFQEDRKNPKANDLVATCKETH